MSGIDDLDFDDLVDGVINTIDDAQTQKIAAKKLFAPKARKNTKTPILSGKEMAATAQGAIMAEDETIDSTLDDTSRIQPSGGAKPPEMPFDGGPSASFESIYQRGGVPEALFSVYRLEQLMNDTELGSLDQSARVVAVRAILRSHDVEVDSVIADAVARTAALDAHDNRIRGQIDRVERELEKENAKLQKEIEDYANPRIAKMEKNNVRVERLRTEYSGWTARRAAEVERITTILEPWGSDDRLRVTHRVPAPEAVTAPTIVSGDDAFEPQVEAPRAVAADVVAAAQADQWVFDDEPKPAPPPPRRAPADSTFDADAVGATGELEFTPTRLRIPESALQGIAAGLGVLMWIVGGILLAAQLTMVVAYGAVAIAWGAPVALAFLVAVATRRSNNYWTGFFSMLLVWSLVAFIVAHAMGPAALVRKLTDRPIWFIEELGLSTELEQGVFNATSQYSALIAPIFGVEPAAPAGK